MDRKPYHALSHRHKKRRIEQLFPSEKNTTCISGTSLIRTEKYESESSEDRFDMCNNSSSSPESTIDDKIYSPIPVQDTACNIPDTSQKAETKLSNTSPEVNIENAICNWSVECPNVPKTSIRSLLKHMNTFFPGVHLSLKKVLGEEDLHIDVTNMGCGRFAYFKKWPENITSHINQVNFTENILKIHINVDGIPLFSDSRKNHAYPILIKCCTNPPKIICAGLYISENENSNKMPNVNIFLDKFVTNLKHVVEEGIFVKGKIINVKVEAFICDAPARADLKQIVNHNSYHACERCVQKGTYAGGHVVLSDLYAPGRTDSEFVQRMDPNHHKTEMSILCKLDMGMVSGFVLDYMHLVCLGVTKRLLLRLKSSKRTETKCHMNSENLNKMDEDLIRLKNWIPSDFARNLSGGFSSLKHWKATEFRLFLLYVGPIVLKSILPNEQYVNFLYLHAAMRILLSKNQENNMVNVRNLMQNFVKSAEVIYGSNFISYNVHSLIHLPEDYLKFGPLDNISCFIFENYLGTIIKGRISGHYKPLEQLMRHVTNENCKISPMEKSSRSSKMIPLQGIQIRCGMSMNKDNGILLRNGSMGFVEKYDGENVEIKLFIKSKSFYDHPVDSTKVGILKLKSIYEVQTIEVDDIASKVMFLPHGNSIIGIKIL